MRRYELGDRGTVWELPNLALHHIGAHGGNGPWDEDLLEIPAVYLADGGEFLVGVLDNHIVAMGGLRRRDERIAAITRMRVHPAAQRRGFGRRLLHALEDRARALGFLELTLDTTERQAAAIELYRGEGYTETGRGKLGGMPCRYFTKRL